MSSDTEQTLSSMFCLSCSGLCRAAKAQIFLKISPKKQRILSVPRSRDTIYRCVFALCCGATDWVAIDTQSETEDAQGCIVSQYRAIGSKVALCFCERATIAPPCRTDCEIFRRDHSRARVSQKVSLFRRGFAGLTCLENFSIAASLSNKSPQLAEKNRCKTNQFQI